MPHAVWLRRSALGTLGCLLGFVGFMAASMALYPGGNWLDLEASGYRFFSNFFCDLTQPVSLSGVDNGLGSTCAQIGIWCFALALLGFFWLLPLHFSERARSRAAVWVRAPGVCSVLGVGLVPLLPSQRFGHFHGVLALTAVGFGLFAALVAVIALCRARGVARALGFLGALALLTAACDAALFAYHFNDGAPPSLFLPAAQKVASLLLSAWMVLVAWYVLNPRPPSVIRRP